ncbi:AAA family ATPase [Candidatus Poribacteria bacterium]|nr:AAA family ATPase [Candidatus Poribacteria bacterium]MYH82410.1 AAA family ATPase [Candidatus Poribacteria bacterium]MYK95769.1 AAA family ATPase [Candidatus Poribacteria bacterium]
MPVPVLTFFNNKGGVGKTSLVYHLAWMLHDLDYQVLACDLDPQANLTSMFIDEERLEVLWPDSGVRKTIYNSLQPLLDGTGDIKQPHLETITQTLFMKELSLIVGDLMLSSAEDELSSQWPECLDRRPRAFRVISALWRILQMAADKQRSEIILVDVGPNLGALNRAALVATDYVVVPLGADLFSLQGLRNLGPTLQNWRGEWKDRHNRNPIAELPIPDGLIQPIGYVVQQHSVRLERPVKAYDKWVNRMPVEYARNLLGNNEGPYARTPAEDKENALATVKHYRSLVPMAQEARKPIFHLTPADGAIGAHAAAARDAHKDFKILAEKIVKRIGI